MNDNFYENHHFSKSVEKDCYRLMDRYKLFYEKKNLLPTDEANMKFFGWTKDHLNRCFQMLKEIGVVDYSRNNRRSTLKFLGKYSCLNGYLIKQKRGD